MVHLYFNDDDEELPTAPAAAPPLAHPAVALPPVPSTAQRAPPLLEPRCAAWARADFQDDPCYVFRAVPSPDGSHIAASLSSNTIKLYALGEAALAHAANLGGHSDRLTELLYPEPSQPWLLFSCSLDGSIKGWDTRSRQPVENYSTGTQALLSCAVSGTLVVGGGEGDVWFWDRRMCQPLSKFDDMHMEDVTQVLLHSESQKLITASEDGLIAVHDISKGLNEDDGFQAALNAGTSVEEVGLYGVGGERLWCRTGTETLQLWEWVRATRDDVEGGDVALLDLVEPRAAAAAAAAAAGGRGAAALHHSVDYLVTCHYDAASGQLLLVAGNTRGVTGFFPVREPVPGGCSGGVTAPAVVLAGGHSAVVRSVQCFAGAGVSTGMLCVSGGEDAKVCVWSLQSSGAPASSGSGDSKGPARLRQAHPTRRKSPY